MQKSLEKSKISKAFVEWSIFDWWKIVLFDLKKYSEEKEKKIEAFEEKNTMPTINYGGGSVMLWELCGPDIIRMWKKTMYSTKYQHIIEVNVPPSVHKLKMKSGWLFQ